MLGEYNEMEKKKQTLKRIVIWLIKIEKHKKRNSIETKRDKDRILWLNEKHIEERLDHKNLREITTKYYLEHRKHIHELDNK